MRIRVRRTGGFAGIERSAEVDTAGLPDADGWHALAGAVLDGGSDGGRGVPDGFAYEITVDGVTVRCCDPRLTDAQRTLITRVLKEGA
ncbi:MULTISPECIES: protealysin inhibitor emfourin [unclassified Streptomyces]|uniref:protealysin inhibitor emfourin n=1 Tax=unclassified Streptomyces TaxID=2593676 RepID=UPI0006FA38DB|nr:MULTISPECIES: protealysin inhibitor emfourin [unclassified Streptomyces]KQX53005.1 metalloprotease [Streptomyces sp. Root1304]KRA89925.1 metalloprotease [Streptomyces sp. Root66D1]